MEIWFTCPCPAPPCNGYGDPIEWTHAKCGGYEKINQYGILRCVRCGTSGPMYEWKFDCSDHGYKKGTYASFKHSLNIVLSLVEDDADADFIAGLILKLMVWKLEGHLTS